MVALGYPLPRQYQVTGRFGDARPSNLLTGGKHTGIDLGAPGNTPVLAAAGGVARTWWNPAGGRMVGIVHAPGVETRYAHLMRALVRTGDRVGAGQQIGLVGATGIGLTGPHLHYEVLLNGKPVDPAPYLGGANATTVNDSRPIFLPVSPDGTCPTGYVRGSTSGVIRCVRQDAQMGLEDVPGAIAGFILPPLLEPALNIAVVAGGALLIWRGVMTMLKP